MGDDGAVETNEGVVRGQPAGNTCSFLGVAYAAPPLARMRFRPPGPAPLHPPTDAAAFGPACSQIDLEGATSGDEDCLYLNVWTRAPVPGPHPVLVFLHGGGNVFGSSQESVYAGATLAERGALLVVTLDYRLGAFGYLAHPALSEEQSPPSSGNYGLLDQQAALVWVHENIAKFGGDPARVTIFGQSAGGRTVCALLAARSARDLFQGAWIQSGTCDYPLLAAQEDLGQRLAENMGCADGAHAAACLRDSSRDALLRGAPGYPTLLDGSFYNPNIDGGLLTEHPLAVFAGEESPRVPIVIGSNADEVAEVAPDIASAGAYPASVEAVFGRLATSILPHYPLSDFDSPRAALIRMITDARYTCPLNRTAHVLANRPGAAVYRALFSHRWPVGASGEPAAFHGLELRFLFRTFERLGSAPSTADAELSDDLIARVAAFARGGDPNPPGLAQWLPFGATTLDYLNLDVPSTPETDLARSVCEFWDSL